MQILGLKVTGKRTDGKKKRTNNEYLVSLLNNKIQVWSDSCIATLSEKRRQTVISSPHLTPQDKAQSSSSRRIKEIISLNVPQNY